MKRILVLLLIFGSCTKDHLTKPSNPVATGNITIILNKKNLSDSVVIYTNYIPATFAGRINGNVLTVTSVSIGALSIGDQLCTTGIANGTKITGFITGNGGIGTYNLNISQNIGNTTFVVDFTGLITWGDGNTTTINSTCNSIALYKHKYNLLGTYTINAIYDNPNSITSFTLGKPDSVISIMGLGSILNGNSNGYELYKKNLVLTSTKLTTIDLSGNTFLSNINLDSNRLSTADVNSVLISIDNSGLAAGCTSCGGNIPYLWIKQATRTPPTGLGLTAMINLLAKGWHIDHD